MEIKLVDGAKIMSQKAHNIPENLRQKVKNEKESVLEAGVIEPSDSAWSSPLVTVPKVNGSVRLCVDYRALYYVTPFQRVWLPSLEEILGKAGHARVMSNIDLARYQ